MNFFCDMIRYCQASYHTPTDLPTLRKMNLGDLPLTTFFNQLSKDKQFAFFVMTASQAVICFQGTNNIKEMIQDLRAWKEGHDSVYAGIEDGFACFVRDFFPWILDNAIAAHKAGVPLYLTGHSLGAAAATIATRQLWKVAKIKVQHVVTFGEPESLRPDLAQEYDSMGVEHDRIVTQYDIVPELPPDALGYQEVGQETMLYESWFYPIPAVFFVHRGIASHNLDKCYAPLLQKQFGGA